MFTGLVKAVGTVVEARPVAATGGAAEVDLRVDLGDLPGPFAIGDSIAISGVCCTVTELAGRTACFRLSAETLARTWLGAAGPSRAVNLETALRAGDPLGGHIVQGHVDGLGEVTGPIDPTAGGTFGVALPPELLRYCVEKGSIALDGVSLTVAALRPAGIEVAVIPHTAAATTLGAARRGDPLNVEVDVLAKYVERLVAR